jgi:hypothetical protein
MISARSIAIVAALAAAVLVLVLWPKKPLSPEDEIRALVGRCVTAAEEKNVSGISDVMAPEFSGPSGASRDEVKSLIAYQVLRGNPGAVVFNPSLDVTAASPTSGTFSGKFVFARGKEPGAAQLSAYQIEAKLEKRDGKWLVLSANYKQL